MDELFQTYLQKLDELEKLTKTVDKLKFMVIDHIVENVKAPVEFNGKKFSTRTTYEYVYSSEVSSLETELDTKNKNFKKEIKPLQNEIKVKREAERKLGVAKQKEGSGKKTLIVKDIS